MTPSYIVLENSWVTFLEQSPEVSTHLPSRSRGDFTLRAVMHQIQNCEASQRDISLLLEGQRKMLAIHSSKTLILLLEELHLLPNGNTRLKEVIRQKLRAWGISPALSLARLESAHTKLSLIMNSLYSDSESYRTPSEKKFLTLFKKLSKRNIWRSAWVGPFQIDALVLSCKSERRGRSAVAFEIDGGVHNGETKGKKDRQKDAYLESLGIVVHRIHNADVLSRHTQNLIRGIASTPRHSTRTLRLLKRRIFIETIACASSDQKFYEANPTFLKDLTGLSRIQIGELIGLVCKHKRSLRQKGPSQNLYAETLQKKRLKTKRLRSSAPRPILPLPVKPSRVILRKAVEQ